MQNYYNVLGVDEKATPEQIKKAFRKASLKNHPDRGGSKEDFQKINDAYQTLGDPDKKRQYDMQRNNPFMGSNNFNMGGGPEDIFKMFFGKRRRHAFWISRRPKCSNFSKWKTS